jgi:hypothetical protein
MEQPSRPHDRRNSIRVNLVAPAVYTRFDNKGRACDQKPSKSMNVSSGGVRLKSSFPVESGEMLDISMALGNNSVTFKGKVVYVTPADDQGFELGICIEEIENQDRIALTRFVIQKWQKEGI